VEIGMVGQVEDGRLVGGGGVVNAQFVIVGERVGHGDREIAGISFFPVGAEVGQRQPDAIGRSEGFCAPDDLVKAYQPAVQVVGAIVLGQLVGFAVEGEAALGDAVGIAACDTAEI